MRDTASILPLSVSGLTWSAGGKNHLEDVSFTLPRGGVVVLLGPNGSGKSLTLKLCHGILEPSSGVVRWALSGGEALGRKRHAMLFQKPAMLRRSALRNVTHALAAAGHGWRERRGLAEDALRRVGLADLAHRPARHLSGGEQQRLALARAMALRPEALFLDEPSSQLDPGATRQFELLLKGLKADGVTLLMSTHDLGQARRLADRVLFLHRGRLVEDQPATDFFRQPASREARAFLAGDLIW